jgi:hypothetical protein
MIKSLTKIEEIYRMEAYDEVEKRNEILRIFKNVGIEAIDNASM